MIRLLVIVGAIYLVLKLLRRYVFPFLLKQVLQKLTGQYQQGTSQEQRKRPKGSVTIDTKVGKKKKIIDKSEGDYIDFTEV